MGTGRDDSAGKDLKHRFVVSLFGDEWRVVGVLLGIGYLTLCVLE